MKSLHFLVTLLFSVFSTLTNGTPPPPSPAVLDTDGHQLQAGAKYHIIPALQSTAGGGGGGGLALSAKDIPCPFYVMQENIESSLGLPARFLPVDTEPNEGVTIVTLSNDVNIVFNAATICVQSTVWKVGDFDGKTGRRYVISNGILGYNKNNNNTGGGVRSLFRIEKAAAAAARGGAGGGGGNDYYKIVYCPSGSGKVLCGDLGVFSENGKRWIGLSDDPLLVLFKKA